MPHGANGKYQQERLMLALGILKEGHAIHSGEISPLLEATIGVLLGPDKTECLTMGHQAAM